MKKIPVLVFALLGLVGYAHAAPTKALQGPLTYAKFDSSSALMAIEGDAASAIFDDMTNVQIQQILRLQVKVGKSTTCFRGREVAKWKTTCYVAFTDLTHGLIDTSQRMTKP